VKRRLSLKQDRLSRCVALITFVAIFRERRILAGPISLALQ